MTLIVYEAWTPRPETERLVNTASDIIDEYEAQGFSLTLRQLYYQFVARDIISNTERSYKNLGNTIVKARMAGLLSWTAIEDRTRTHHTPWIEEDDQTLISDLSAYIRFDQWARQDYYVEVWVEKEALGEVIEQACDPFLVTHMACKGYMSTSELWRAGQRFQEKADAGKKGVLIHLGDHDPSGIDMTRDNDSRVRLFSDFSEVDVRRIALNMDQIDEHKPPPNPTKYSDSRATGYLANYGESSWELDALEPAILVKLITEELESLVDRATWNEVLWEEEKMKSIFENLANNWPVIKLDLEN